MPSKCACVLCLDMVVLAALLGCGGDSRDVSVTQGAEPATAGDDGSPATGAADDNASAEDGGSTGEGASAGSGSIDSATGDDTDPATLERFSFFVTSLEIMRELSGSQDGFGGDLGGLAGADDICREAADRVGFGAKTWRAFLSVTDGGDGNPVHAIDRIGEGPWYDRNGRLIAQDLAGLLQDRPAGEAAAVNDLPNEFGEGLQQMGDTHDILTGSNAMGMLDSPEPENTCLDWTSTTAVPIGGGFGFPGGSGAFGMPGGGDGDGDSGPGGFMPGGAPGGLRVGHSWPAFSGMNWIAAHSETSCAAGVNLVQNGPGDGSSVGAGGGWGAIYCFALQP